MAPTFVSGIPIYVQIADDIRAQILRGTLRAGDQLTSTTSTPRPTASTRPPSARPSRSSSTRASSKSDAASACSSPKRPPRARGDGLASYVEETLNPAVEAGLALGLDIDAIIDHVRAYSADTTAKDNS